MKIEKQKELINSFLSELDEKNRSLYQDIITYLSELGYHPQKVRGYMVFKHDLHNKQMAKMGIKKNKEQLPFFALRFSACTGYSKRFADIVSEAIAKYPARAARCINDECNFCRGEAVTHVYITLLPDSHCGAYALEIPDITADDIEEIKKLIKEEHKYLLKHEAGINE